MFKFTKKMTILKKIGRELNRERSIDVSVEKTLKSVKSGYKVVPSMEIKAWKAYLTVTFVAGFAAALVWGTYMSVYQSSQANEPGQVTLFTSASSASHKSGENFAVPIFLDTAGRNIVAVQVVYNFDKNTLEFVSADISGSGFNYEIKNSVDASLGQGYIDLGKPTPGASGSEVKVAILNFRAISDVSEPTVALKFDSAAAVSDSAAILDDGQGTNALQRVLNKMANVPAVPEADFSINAITGLTDTVIRIGWTDGPFENSKYLVERKTGTADFSKIGEAESTERVFVDRTAKPSKLYAYRICQENGSGEKSCTAGKQVKTLKKKKIFKPRLTAGIENGKVRLSWAPAYARDFNVVLQRKIGKAKKFTTISVVSSDTENSYLDEAVTPGTKYAYRMMIKARKKTTVTTKQINISVP